MDTRIKSGKLWLATFMLICFASVNLFAQNYGHYKYVSPSKYDFQQAIVSATFNTWNDLKLLVRGEYDNTQEAFARAAREMTKAVNQNPAAFFNLPQQATSSQNTEKLSAKEKLAKEVEAQNLLAVQKAILLTRYNSLQQQIQNNHEIFPGYVLAGKTNLASLSDRTIAVLLNLFHGTDSSNTLSFRFEKQDDNILIFVDDTTQVTVVPKTRQLFIEER